MLKMACMETNSDEINKLIYNEDYKYLRFSDYTDSDMVDIKNSDWHSIQRVSVNDSGKIIGYMSAGVDIVSEKVDSLFLCRFNNELKYDFGYSDDFAVFKKDLNDFMEYLVNHHKFRYIEFVVIKDNPACKTYDKWIEKYGGYKHEIKKSVKLKDGKFYDVVEYFVYCKRWEDE